MSIVVSELIRLALMEIRSARAGEAISAEDAADGLLLLNEYLDHLNATDRGIYTTTATTYTMTSGLQPHTIGVTANSPTFTVTVARPDRILSANVVLTGNVRVPVDIIDQQQWDNIRAGAAAGQAVTISSRVPLVLYYDTGWPNGSIYLWPVPTGNSLELRYETLFADVALTDTFTLPPGYQQAVRLTLAELMASSWGQPVASETRRKAQQARDAIWDNYESPLNAVPDGGSSGGGTGGRFNYLTGQVLGRTR